MLRWFSIVSVIPVALALVACVDDPEAALDSETQAISPCPKWGCGENSPLMGPYGEHEYDSSGAQLNSEGSRVIALVQGGVEYTPRVNGSQLIGVHADGTVIAGLALTNAYLLISTPTGPYKIIFKKVTPRASSQVRFWIGPATQIETYELMYLFAGRGPATHPEPLCHNPPERDAGEGSPTRLWHAPLEAILYTGDRYDADLKTVTAASYGASGTWFNIACAGSALAKLHLTRHTTAGSLLALVSRIRPQTDAMVDGAPAAGALSAAVSTILPHPDAMVDGSPAAGSLSTFTSTAAQRQAMLKMYVSDVCGNGQAWTEQGTRLHWANSMGWSALTGAEFAHEAFWDEHGAQCLDVHRLGSTFKAQLEAECPAIALNNPCPPGGLPAGAYLSSAVPFDPF